MFAVMQRIMQVRQLQLILVESLVSSHAMLLSFYMDQF